MADLLGDSSLPEGNNFDNGFEKLDPFSPESSQPEAHMMPGDDGDALVSSTSQLNQQEMPEEDLYTNEPPPPSSEAEPLVDVAPMVVPSSEPLIPEFAPAAPQQPVSSTFDAFEPTQNSEPLIPHPVAPVAAAAEEPSPVPVVTPEKSEKSTEKSACTAESWLQGMDPRVVDLIYWRDVKKTGVVFGSVLVVLFSLALFSVLSVMAYLSLAALTVTMSFRVYKNVLTAIQKTGEGHPFKDFLEVEIALPEDKVHQLADMVMGHVACALRELRRVFLVEDMVDSIKFALVLWVLTYIGAWFNGMTLIILAVVAVFTLPKVYETHQVQIDQYIDLAKAQIKNVIKQVQEKIPLPGKKKTA